jgi:septal ring factor EnvC (AmiA/AmiB activator)
VAAKPSALEIVQVYALRAWTTWLQSQISDAQPELERQIGEHQREIAQLRATMDRSRLVLKSLQMSIDQIDEILRKVQDTDIADAAMRLAASTQERPSSGAISPVQSESAMSHDDTRARN